MKTKTIVIAASLAVAGLIAIGYAKVKTLTAVFDKMTSWVSGISNFKVASGQATFNLNVTIKNPTDTDFTVSGLYVAKVKRVLVYMQGQYLATATVNMDAIDIPAYSQKEISNIPFSTSIENTLVTVLSSVLGGQTLSLNNLTIVTVIEVLGQEYNI